MSNFDLAQRQAKLVLEDGSEFLGWAFGKCKSAAGEVIFNTGMSGLIQSLTDPGCKGQIFVSTWPIAGNIGVPVNKNGAPFFDEHGIPVLLESEKAQANGLIVSDLCEEPSHYSMKLSLSAWLEKCNIPGIYGIDTRALAIRLRDRGTMRGKILIEKKDKQSFDDISFSKIKLTNESGFSDEIKTYTPSKNNTGLKIALIDCGVKANIIRCFLNRGLEVIRIPCNLDIEKINYDGLLISNGPGDPKEYKKLIDTVRTALSSNKPVLGVGLGNLIMALAAGADTYKLHFGHRGQNQPSYENTNADEGKNRCYVTSQNHGYAVRAETLPPNWKQWFTNANDGTVEGIRCENKPFKAVQFYPEGCPGSRDTEFVFDNFISDIKESKK
ncbi:MAG: glutamine-hydrolyzing carbamoyl-phosphate synthase small subunit [Treponema sp.]|nr:glutamine-hydrolyzing carbamoyl-phosphate synthase small subunit [Treponema sp.]